MNGSVDAGELFTDNNHNGSLSSSPNFYQKSANKTRKQKKKDPPISISMSAQNTTLKILFSSTLAFPRLYTVGHQWTVVSEGSCLIEFSG